jgi:hypothetical protein
MQYLNVEISTVFQQKEQEILVASIGGIMEGTETLRILLIDNAAVRKEHLLHLL